MIYIIKKGDIYHHFGLICGMNFGKHPLKNKILKKDIVAECRPFLRGKVCNFTMRNYTRGKIAQ